VDGFRLDSPAPLSSGFFLSDDDEGSTMDADFVVSGLVVSNLLLRTCLRIWIHGPIPELANERSLGHRFMSWETIERPSL